MTDSNTQTTDSITQAINDWLLTRPLISENYDIEIEELPDGTQVLALQRSGVELIKRYFQGRKEEYQYMLFLKENSEGDNTKIANFDWLDDLVDDIYKQVENRNFPIIENKQVSSMRCANQITYEVNEDGTISNYAVQLYFTITSF
jgi:hypothetical protein